MTSTVLITSSGQKHYISDQDIASAFRELLAVGYSTIEASDLALSIVIARHEADDLNHTDLLYGRSDYTQELAVLASFNSKRYALAQKD